MLASVEQDRGAVMAKAGLAPLAIGAVLVAATTAPAPTPAAETPSTSDITLTAKITERHCFGSAGCNVSFQVKTAYSGPTLSADDTWLITYQVTGVDDGPIVGSFDLTGDEYTVGEESAGTKNAKSKVTIKVTGIDKVGI